MNMQKVEDWLSTIPSQQTRKNYLNGIRKFENEFYKKPIESLLELDDTELGHVVERFYSWLKQSHPQNTARNQTNTVIQYLKHHGKNPRYKRSLGIFHTVISTKDHLLTIEEVQKMAQFSDLKEQILCEVFIMGLRISDCARLEWKMFEHPNEETPIPITIPCQKEETVAQSFISAEFQQLLTKYLTTIDRDNKFLFQGKKDHGHLTAKQLDRTLKAIAKRAGLQASIHWHLGRKLVLRTASELGLNQWCAKLLVGKSVPADIMTYIQGVQLQNAFVKLSNVIRLFPKPQAVNGEARKMLDSVFQILRSLVEDKLKEQGLMKKTKPVDWQAIYQQLLPEEEREEKVQID